MSRGRVAWAGAYSLQLYVMSARRPCTLHQHGRICIGNLVKVILQWRVSCMMKCKHWPRIYRDCMINQLCIQNACLPRVTWLIKRFNLAWLLDRTRNIRFYTWTNINVLITRIRKFCLRALMVFCATFPGLFIGQTRTTLYFIVSDHRLNRWRPSGGPSPTRDNVFGRQSGVPASSLRRGDLYIAVHARLLKFKITNCKWSKLWQSWIGYGQNTPDWELTRPFGFQSCPTHVGTCALGECDVGRDSLLVC